MNVRGWSAPHKILSVGSGSVSQPGRAAPGFEFFQVAPFPDHSNGREKSS